MSTHELRLKFLYDFCKTRHEVFGDFSDAEMKLMNDFIMHGPPSSPVEPEELEFEQCYTEDIE